MQPLPSPSSQGPKTSRSSSTSLKSKKKPDASTPENKDGGTSTSKKKVGTTTDEIVECSVRLEKEFLTGTPEKRSGSSNRAMNASSSNQRTGGDFATPENNITSSGKRSGRTATKSGVNVSRERSGGSASGERRSDPPAQRKKEDAEALEKSGQAAALGEKKGAANTNGVESLNRREKTTGHLRCSDCGAMFKLR